MGDLRLLTRIWRGFEGIVGTFKLMNQDNIGVLLLVSLLHNNITVFPAIHFIIEDLISLYLLKNVA